MNKISRLFIVVVVSLVLICFISPVVCATDSNIDEYAEEFDYESFLSQLDGDTIHILSEIGITELFFCFLRKGVQLAF